MSAVEHTSNRVSPAVNVVDGAGGVEKSYCFVAIVNHNSEKQFAEILNKKGYVNYLPTQQEIRVWKNGRKSKVDRVVMPSLVFVYCTEQERKGVVKLPFIYRFMTDRAASADKNTCKRLAKITDTEISRLKFMLGQSDIPVVLTSCEYRKGDRVRVIRGGLAGLEGTVTNLKSSKSELMVELGVLGCATLSIETVNLELADSKIRKTRTGGSV